LKKISFGNQLFEFQCDPVLLESALNHFLNSEIQWKPSGQVDMMENFMSYGYMDDKATVPYYYEELFNWFQDCIDEIIEDQKLSLDLIICDSWGTQSKFGEGKSRPHQHANSILSGVFYYTTHARTKTIFYKNNPIAEIVNRTFNHDDADNLLNANLIKSRETFSSESLAGKLLIFPSNLLHSISAHSDMKNTRYTMSFNTFVSGKNHNDTATARLDFNVKSSKEKYLEYIQNKKLILGDKK